MKIHPLRLMIRRLVLATSFPPFLQIYRGIYTAVTLLALRLFKAVPAITAVYLTRGAAEGRVIPLVSDIDFKVIAEGLDEEDREALFAAYGRLARRTTLLDQTLEVYDEATVKKHYEINDYFQYRCAEGKKTWKLLYGKDVIAELPSLPPESMYGGFYAEIKVWWANFSWRFFQESKYADETITRNNTCFKVVAEVLKMNLALNRGRLTFDRREALREGRPELDETGQSLVARLERSAARGFRAPDPTILGDTLAFLFRYLERFHESLESHPFARPIKDIPSRIDYAAEDKDWIPADADYVSTLIDYFKKEWAGFYRGAYLVPSVYFNIDEFVFLAEVDPERPPTVSEIRALTEFHQRSPSAVRSRIKLFALLPHAAFRMDPDDLKKSWQSILCPVVNPEVFELAAMPACGIDGGSLPAARPPWTRAVQHFFWEEEMLFFELLENPSIYKLNSLDFLRIFWKSLQLVILNRWVERGEVLYPMTPAAIRRATQGLGLPPFSHLDAFERAYREAVSGKPQDIARRVPEAVAYLKEIGP